MTADRIPFSIAIIGCGRISANHFDAVKRIPQDFKLLGVCDNSKPALNSATGSQEVPGFSSLRETIRNLKPDIVSLCTPSGLHAEQAIEALELGCHVISEKPLATRLEHGLSAHRTSIRTEKKLFVVQQNRLNPTVKLLKQAIDQGLFGRIYHISANVFWTRPQSYYDVAPWRGTWEFDGGAMMNQASHYVDLLTWLCGPLESVFAFTSTLARKIEAEDSGVMALKFRSGTLGSMNVSMLTFPKNLEGSVTIIGEKGTVRLGGVALNKFDTWEFSEKTELDEQAKKASYDTSSVYGFGHEGYYAEVAKALRGEPSAAATGRDGITSLSTLVGAYRSSRDRMAIGFPLDM